MAALIAFDLDDTLYKERDYVRSGLKAVADAISATAGIDRAELQAIADIAPDGHAAFEAFAARLAGTPVGELFPISRMVTEYRNHRPVLEADTATAAVLEELRRRGHILALITDGNTVRQHAKVSALGLTRFFEPEAIIVSDDSGSDKTTPAPFAAAEAIAPGMRKVYVGDNTAKDFHWPQLRGWHTVMLRDSAGLNVHPQRPADVPPHFRPQTTIDSLQELLKLTY